MSGNATRMGAHGRVVIPSGVREELRLRQGDRLIVVVEEGALRLLTPDQAIREAQAMVRKYLKPGRDLVQELLDERKEEVRKERREIGRLRRLRGNPRA